MWLTLVRAHRSLMAQLCARLSKAWRNPSAPFPGFLTPVKPQPLHLHVPSSFWSMCLLPMHTPLSMEDSLLPTHCHSGVDWKTWKMSQAGQTLCNLHHLTQMDTYGKDLRSW